MYRILYTDATSQVLRLELAVCSIEHTTLSHYSTVHDSFSSGQVLTAALICGSLLSSVVNDRDAC
jgi:hypothetical protein